MPQFVPARHVGGLLVVDDEPDMRMLLKLMLSVDPRLQPHHDASTSDDAIRLLDTIQPALIVLDHGLQGSSMSGLQVAPILKARVPDAKILLFSAFDMSRHVSEEPAVDVYLQKADITHLLEAAQHLLGIPPLDHR